MEPWPLIFIIIFLLLSALFSGAELAFVSSNKLFFELKNNHGIWYGKIISRFIKNPARFIGTTLFGFTLSFIGYCILMMWWISPALINLLGSDNMIFILIVEIIVSSSLIILFGDILPRSLFLANPDRVLVILALPLQFVYIIFQPIVSLIIGLSKFITIHLLHWKYVEDKPAFGITDLNNFIKNRSSQANKSVVVEIDTEILDNALEFKSLKIRDCMIPRADIEALKISDSIEKLKEKFIQTGRSKILIYEDSIDEIVGYCHASSLFKKPEGVRDIIIPITIIPESMPAQDLMVQFIKEHKSIALVVDEFGGTSGIVTIEDIIEEIVGDIQDEHDEDELREEKVDEHTYLVSARHEIEYLNEKYKWNIPEGSYETLGGFIISITGDIPDVDDVVYYPPFKFTVVSKEEAYINIVKVFIGSSLNN